MGRPADGVTANLLASAEVLQSLTRSVLLGLQRNVFPLQLAGSAVSQLAEPRVNDNLRDYPIRVVVQKLDMDIDLGATSPLLHDLYLVQDPCLQVRTFSKLQEPWQPYSWRSLELPTLHMCLQAYA